MSNLYVLYEHASGYSLFRVKEFEEIGALISQVEQNALDLSKFNSVVKLIAFAPFTSGLNALDNLNSISEGVLHEDLRLFLDTNMPKQVGKKENKIQLGVADSKISSVINEALAIQCTHVGAVPEIIRGIRLHFPNLVKGLTEKSQAKAQLGLGHAYSRSKVKFNVNRVDNMIIQAINLTDQLDKDINTFSMRIREWYGYHFPELIKIVTDNNMYAKVVRIVKNRKELTEDMLEQLEEVVMDSAKAKAIIDASKSSMGIFQNN
jgi:nucleolar protein 56